ncbi:MAG: VWA domain-containing protein [Gammaproteobacteria bacterium]|nr:VWA domain-containing protein [Gammaproteobacteria bacterium]
MSVYNAYVGYSSELAGLVGPERAIALADTVSSLAIKAGRAAAAMLPAAAVRAAIKLERDPIRFSAWANLMERFANLAPESIPLVLEQTDRLLTQLNVSRLEAWILAGIRSAGSDAEKRRAFFSFEDPEAGRWLEHESGSVVFSEMDRELKAFMGALWGVRVPIREPSSNAADSGRRRASFGSGVIRIPSTYPGFRGEQAKDLFRAVIAHIGAHYLYSGSPFPVGKLKPIQVALVSLIEDARVEKLAMRDFPGLRRLWLPFHIAQASGALTAPSLLARLSRALMDPDFKDENSWVNKTKAMFYDRRREWENPLLSREIGGLIGNDLGQMRVQFNDRTYTVEPPYRDDNTGLWDFGDASSADMLESEMLFDSVDIQEQQDEDKTPPDREREEQEQDEASENNIMSVDLVEENGLPVARYSEYDYLTGRSRPEWTTIVEYTPTPGPTNLVDDILESHPAVVNRIRALITSAKISRPQKVMRQPEGEFLDLNAGIEAMISRRVGEQPDPQVYGRSERRQRDLSIHVLLDISESTRDKVLNSNCSVLDLERQATALLAHAMSGLGDPFAIAAFSSNRREEVRYHRIKDFGMPYGQIAKSYLAGLESGYSTRLGAAMRHAAADLIKQQTHRRLLLVITDGEPSDLDVTDKAYLVEDARHVIHDLGMSGIDVFCVGLDSGGDSYLTRIFGRRNVVQIDRLDRLPEKLPMLYFRLTS